MKITIYWLTALLVILSLSSCKKDHQAQLAFYNVDETARLLITERATHEESGLASEVEIILVENREELFELVDSSNPPDLLFFNDIGVLDDLEPQLADLREGFAGRIPRSMAALGVVEGRRVAYPLQLDHMELALNEDYFSNVTNDQGIVQITLADLEQQLQSQISRYFFPLVIAGKDDQILLDFISLMTLTMSGNRGLENFVQAVEQGKTFQGVMDTDLGNGASFSQVVEKLVNWKSSGILHVQWLDFKQSDVLTFMEEGLTGAVILRLSHHREIPLEVIKDYQAIPLPQNGMIGRAVDIYCPPLSVAVPQESAIRGEAIRFTKELLLEDFQEELTFQSGLAPVNATSPSLDVQSADVRFWAAASRQISRENPMVSHEKYDLFLEELRSYLNLH